MQLRQICWPLLCSTGLMLSISRVGNATVPAGSFTNVRLLLSEFGWRSGIAEPHVSLDGLTLYFAEQNRSPNYGGHDLYQATRESTDERFGHVTNLGRGVNSSRRDLGPMVSDDGLRLYYFTDFNRIHMASRESTDQQFDDPVELTTLRANGVVADPFVSPDELTVYFTSTRSGGHGEGDLYQATRTTTSEPFGDVTNLGDGVNSRTQEMGQSVSADGLVIFFCENVVSPYRPGGTGNSDIWVATRSTTEEPFGTAVNLNNFSQGSELNSREWDLWPHISRDWPAHGSKLYFVSQQPTIGIYEATWELFVDPDFDGNGILDVTDLDLLSAEVRAGTHASQFDLDCNGQVNQEDHRVWVDDHKHTWLGDADLNGEFNSSDMVQVFAAGKYETSDEVGWAEGDWDGNGVFDSSDMVAAFADGGYEQGLKPAVAVVPEPTSVLMLMAVLMGIAVCQRRPGQ